MMNFENLFKNLEEVEDTAIMFPNEVPVYFTNSDHFMFSFKKFQDDISKMNLHREEPLKLLSANNSVICWVDRKHMFVLPAGLGNAEQILKNNGYFEKDMCSVFVPLSNGEHFNCHEQALLAAKWDCLKHIASACFEKY